MNWDWLMILYTFSMFAMTYAYLRMLRRECYPEGTKDIVQYLTMLKNILLADNFVIEERLRAIELQLMNMQQSPAKKKEKV